jgi:protein SDA1
MPFVVDEGTLDYLVQFNHFKNKSVCASARSLINFFRDVNPMLLNKKVRGKEMRDGLQNEKATAIEYGQTELKTGIDGADLLRKLEKLPEGTNIALDRIMDNEDHKKIRLLRLRDAAKVRTNTNLKLDFEEDYADDEGSESEKDDEEIDSDDEESEVEIGEVDAEDEDGSDDDNEEEGEEEGEEEVEGEEEEEEILEESEDEEEH